MNDRSLVVVYIMRHVLSINNRDEAYCRGTRPFGQARRIVTSRPLYSVVTNLSDERRSGCKGDRGFSIDSRLSYLSTSKESFSATPSRCKEPSANTF